MLSKGIKHIYLCKSHCFLTSSNTGTRYFNFVDFRNPFSTLVWLFDLKFYTNIPNKLFFIVIVTQYFYGGGHINVPSRLVFIFNGNFTPLELVFYSMCSICAFYQCSIDFALLLIRLFIRSGKIFKQPLEQDTQNY